jgi:ubiquinone/menaquinone biosynthesis C-methylase UbiE
MEKTIAIDPNETSLDYQVEQLVENLEVPEYLQKTYWWAYLHPRAVKIFERQWLVNLILWGNYKRLRDAALNELGEIVSGHSLQVACVYGDFTAQFLKRLQNNAQLSVIDIAPIQIENLQQKVGTHKNLTIEQQNAANLCYEDNSFEQVMVFFLLHELPADVRQPTVKEALRVVKPGGKVVFVDYHRPVWQHPHRYLMVPILKTLEPFALDLWEMEIADLIPEDCECSHIEKTTYFGGLYQKVVMTVK